VLIGFNCLYMRDLTRYYYPTKQILRQIVYGGEFPYWNRYFSAGQPIAANPEHEIFYPFTWLILLPSYDFGYRLHILMHIYIGTLGMYALLRSMELRAGRTVSLRGQSVANSVLRRVAATDLSFRPALSAAAQSS
jgi:hypothetical protein